MIGRRLDRAQIVMLIAAACVFAIALFPLALALPLFGATGLGVSARGAQGTIWTGRLADAHVGALAIGDTATALRVLPLFVGRAELALRTAGGSATLGLGPGSVALTDADAIVPVAGLFAPLPLDVLALEGARIVFADGRCKTAAGRARTTFSGEVAGLSLVNGLAGVMRCEGGELVVPLLGQSGMEALTLRIAGDGRYTARFSVRAADPALAKKLSDAGFVPGPGGLVMTLDGRL